MNVTSITWGWVERRVSRRWRGKRFQTREWVMCEQGRDVSGTTVREWRRVVARTSYNPIPNRLAVGSHFEVWGIN
jgi:hypothetical protein